MASIRQNDLIQSVRDAFQFISYYHPKDFLDAMASAYEKEQSSAAKDAIAQILTNSRMSAEGHRPICQDTGIATTEQPHLVLVAVVEVGGLAALG